MSSPESDAHGRVHRSVEIGVDPVINDDHSDAILHGDDFEVNFEKLIAEDMDRGVTIPNVDYELVEEVERSNDKSLFITLGILGLGASGAYIWKKHRNKE